MAEGIYEEFGEAPSEKEIFGVSGPFYLKNVDWSVPEQRKSVAACLVQGVYILERDRQKERMVDEELAPFWWEFFHFECIGVLDDPKDKSIFGAIFEYKPYNPRQYKKIPPQHLPPKYVIAFRGTLFKRGTIKQDLKLDLKLPLNKFTQTRRYQASLEAVQGLIAHVGPRQVWLAGHSLGAATALQVGKTMAREECYIESYLFNPPYPSSAPFEKLITSERLRDKIRTAVSVLTAGFSVAIDGTSTTNDHTDPFTILSPWIPHLFVNQKDPISCEYIGYFEHRQKMESWGLGWLEKIAGKKTLISLLITALGGDGGEAFHLIPSAVVVKNMHPEKQRTKLSHGIRQWWEDHPYWEQKLHQFSN